MIEPVKVNKQHDLHMRSRKQLELTGVQNVESFDSEEFCSVRSLAISPSGESFTYQKPQPRERHSVAGRQCPFPDLS